MVIIPAASAAIRLLAVRSHVSKTKAAVTPIRLHFPADPTGDPPEHDVGHLEQSQSPRFLQSDEGLPSTSEGSFHQTHIHI